MLRLGFLLALLMAPGAAFAQDVGVFDAPEGALKSVGWAGFLDGEFMIKSLAALVLAAGLGALIGYHPTPLRAGDKLNESEMPKVYIMYAFVGAVIGVMVREFGLVIGLVVFGIGGLLRFSTDTDSTRDTGRLIGVTLAGLSAGLGLPHLAVITTLFEFVLIQLFDARAPYRIRIEHVPAGRLAESALAYRGILVAHGCKILGEHKSQGKARIEFVFRLRNAAARDRLHADLADAPADLRGDVDWQIE